MEDKNKNKILLRTGKQFLTYILIDKNEPVGIIKEINPQYLKTDKYQKIKEQFEIEKELLKFFDIKGIPKYKDSGEDFLHLSYIRGKNLKEYLLKDKISDKEKIRLLLELSEIIKNIHRTGIVHCDIKPENIIYDGIKVSLIDFGSAVPIGEKSIYVQGSKEFSAPEIFKNENRYVQSDIFSFVKLCIWLKLERYLPKNFISFGIAKNKNERFNSINEVIKIIRELGENYETILHL